MTGFGLAGALGRAELVRRRLVVAVAAFACVLASGLVFGAGSAPALVCVSSGDTVSECALEQTLTTQLNVDVAKLPASVWQLRTLDLALRAESLYPQSPTGPSDYCPSFTAFGALGGYVDALQQVATPPQPIFPPQPILVAISGDVTAIRSAPIWAFTPPAPITVAFPPSPCIQQ